MNTQPMDTNSDVARYMTRVLDALAGYDYLPPVEYVTAFRSGRVFLGVKHFSTSGVRAVCVWAAEFGVPVVLDRTGAVAAELDLDGVPVRLSSCIDHARAYEFGAALGVSVGTDLRVQVPAAALLSVLARRTDVAA